MKKHLLRGKTLPVSEGSRDRSHLVTTTDDPTSFILGATSEDKSYLAITADYTNGTDKETALNEVQIYHS